MNEGKMAVNRLKSVLLKDKLNMSEGFMRALKNDLGRVLSYYMALRQDEGIEVLVESADGGYTVRIKATADGIRQIRAV